jgi:hypothetical protein
MMAIGLELSTDVDMAAVAVASAEGGRHLVDVVWYGSPDDAVAECSRLYSELDNVGTFADPQPCAGILDDLRAAGVWLHLLEATDVAAAAWQYVTEVRVRRLKGGNHPALREAMRSAVPRPLALRFAFERRRVATDMSPLNACAFALWGLRRNEQAAEPGAWLIGDGPGGGQAGARDQDWRNWPDGIPPWVQRQ